MRLKVDVIITGGATDTRAATNATGTIPIVMTNDGNPIGNGIVASLARPCGNITAGATVSPELSGKRIESIRDIAAYLSRVAVFATSNSAITAQELKKLELAAPALALELHDFDVLLAKDLEPAFQAATKERLGAVLMNVSGGIIAYASALRRFQPAVMAT